MSEKDLCEFYNRENAACKLQNKVLCTVPDIKPIERCSWYANGKTRQKREGGIQKGVIILGRIDIGDNVVIKRGTIIYPGVKIGNNVEVGHYCIIYPNSVIPDNTVLYDFRTIDPYTTGFTFKRID